VPGAAVVVRQPEPVLVAGLVEQADLGRLGHAGRHREVDPAVARRRAQGRRPAGKSVLHRAHVTEPGRQRLTWTGRRASLKCFCRIVPLIAGLERIVRTQDLGRRHQPPAPAPDVAGPRDQPPAGLALRGGLRRLRPVVPDIAWAVFAGLNLAAMRLFPAWQTVPFLAIWVSLTVIYGFRLWRPATDDPDLAAVTLATGGIIGVQCSRVSRTPTTWPRSR